MQSVVPGHRINGNVYVARVRLLDLIRSALVAICISE